MTPVTQARLTMKIYDIRGRLIRTLLNNSYSGSCREFLWDGRDNGGHFARMGIYVVVLESVNENPKFNKSAKKTMVLGRKFKIITNLLILPTLPETGRNKREEIKKQQSSQKKLSRLSV